MSNYFHSNSFLFGCQIQNYLPTRRFLLYQSLFAYPIPNHFQYLFPFVSQCPIQSLFESQILNHSLQNQYQFPFEYQSLSENQRLNHSLRYQILFEYQMAKNFLQVRSLFESQILSHSLQNQYQIPFEYQSLSENQSLNHSLLN
jgi:hypothetical protein